MREVRVAQNWEMTADWWEGDGEGGNGSGRKRAGDCGDSVGGVDERHEKEGRVMLAWPWVEESE
jgi:hypothetical protein